MHPFEAITSHEWSVPAELGLPWIPAEQVMGMFPCMTTSRMYSSFFYLPVRNIQKIEAFKARQQTWPVCYAHECSSSYLFNNLNSCSSSSPLLSLVQVPAKLAINLSIHTQHTYDNGVDRTGDRVFRKYSFLHEEREEEKKIFNPQTMLHLEYSLRTEKKKHLSTKAHIP